MVSLIRTWVDPLAASCGSSETTKPSRRHRWTEEVQEGSTQLAPRPVWRDTDLIHLHSVGPSVGYLWGLQLFGKRHIIHPAMKVQVLPDAATLCVVRNLSGDKGTSTLHGLASILLPGVGRHRTHFTDESVQSVLLFMGPSEETHAHASIDAVLGRQDPAA